MTRSTAKYSRHQEIRFSQTLRIAPLSLSSLSRQDRYGNITTHSSRRNVRLVGRHSPLHQSIKTTVAHYGQRVGLAMLGFACGFGPAFAAFDLRCARRVAEGRSAPRNIGLPHSSASVRFAQRCATSPTGPRSALITPGEYAEGALRPDGQASAGIQATSARLARACAFAKFTRRDHAARVSADSPQSRVDARCSSAR